MAGMLPRMHCTVPMKFPDTPETLNGAGAVNNAARGKKVKKPLFGDRRWVQERLRALRAVMASGERRAAA